CPRCKGKGITRLNEKQSKLVYDLKFTAAGVRRQVIRCTAARYRCNDCMITFLPKRYKRLDKHQHRLKSWAMYQHVVHGTSLRRLEDIFEDWFGLRHRLKDDLSGRHGG